MWSKIYQNHHHVLIVLSIKLTIDHQSSKKQHQKTVIYTPWSFCDKIYGNIGFASFTSVTKKA